MKSMTWFERAVLRAKHPKRAKRTRGLSEGVNRREMGAAYSVAPADVSIAEIEAKLVPEVRDIWRMIIRRCEDPRHIQFIHYGGRGIRICAEWRGNFRLFADHVGPRPSPQHTIDRIDNDGHYEPGNVRWATREVQASNKHRSH